MTGFFSIPELLSVAHALAERSNRSELAKEMQTARAAALSLIDERAALRRTVCELQAKIGALTAHRAQLVTELETIAAAEPKKWFDEVRDQLQQWAQNRARDQFQQWAQNRARAAVTAASEPQE